MAGPSYRIPKISKIYQCRVRCPLEHPRRDVTVGQRSDLVIVKFFDSSNAEDG